MMHRLNTNVSIGIIDEVNWGIAAAYPDDVGLERDSALFFKVDFDNVVVASRYIGPISFSEKQREHFVAQGIVVHTDDARLTERMRRARDAQAKSPNPAPKR